MTTDDYERLTQDGYLPIRTWCFREGISLTTGYRWAHAGRVLHRTDRSGRIWILSLETRFLPVLTLGTQTSIQVDPDTLVWIHEDETMADIGLPPAIRQERARAEAMRVRDLLIAQGKTYPAYGPTVRDLDDDMDQAV